MNGNHILPKIYAIILVIMTVTACSKKDDKKEIVTATLNGPSAMAMIYMLDEIDSIGGKSARFIIKSEPEQVKAMIIEESVQFAMVPSTMGALLYNRTGKYILAAIPVWGTLYLFGTDTTIHSWKDLKGKKVSLMARGMTPDIMFRYLAGRNGLDVEKDLQLDYSFPGHIELANAIAAGISQLGVISEPLVSLVAARNPLVKPILNFNKEWIDLFGPGVPFAQTALLVHRDFAENNPGIVNEYLHALDESIKMVNANPDNSAKLIVKFNILPDTVVARAAIPRSNLQFVGAYQEMKGIQEYFKVFYTFNPLTLGGKLPDETFYYKGSID